ncbi:hypothetical protein HY480_01335 [Candidatus Uhrbacteria bacterium]|nr:hypothetical protein [Candidatus Uhrbacteria bacterium]
MDEHKMEGGGCCRGNGGGGGGCKCPHHKMFPLFVFLIGLTFLLGNLGTLNAQTVGIVWPILLGLIGLQKLFSGRCKCC